MSSVLELDSNEPSTLFESPLGEEQAINLCVRVEKIRTILLCVVATLIVTGTTAGFISHAAPNREHKLVKLMNRFDINFEPSIPAWYSSCALLASSALLLLTGLAMLRLRDRFYKHWLGLSVLFLGLSIDEAARFHEMIHIVIVSQIDVHGIFYFPWVVPALIFVGIVGICYVSFLKHIDRRTAMRFLIAGAVYVGGAVGMEIVAGPIVEAYGMLSPLHMVCEAIEESLEMLGVVIFIYALLDHLARCLKPIRFQVLSKAG